MKKGNNFGFNMASEQVEDLLKSGIIDSREVVSACLRYAASSAGTVLLSEALIGNAPEKDDEEENN